jgi:thioredoxin 2
MNAVLDDRGVVETCQQCGRKNRVLFSNLGNLVRCGYCKTDLPLPDTPIDISEEQSFGSLVDHCKLPVLVDFWAGWCGPCKMMAPELSKVANQVSGSCVVAKVDTELLPILAQTLGISALPTLVLFREGQELGRIQGAQPASAILSFVQHARR